MEITHRKTSEEVDTIGATIADRKEKVLRDYKLAILNTFYKWGD